VAICDVAGLTDVDLATIDALARLQLSVLRLGSSIELRNASDELRELLTLAGLDDVVRCSERLTVQVRRQSEQREEPRSVEEEADPGDPIA
jgi:hypothetical protein